MRILRWLTKSKIRKHSKKKYIIHIYIYISYIYKRCCRSPKNKRHFILVWKRVSTKVSLAEICLSLSLSLCLSLSPSVFPSVSFLSLSFDNFFYDIFHYSSLIKKETLFFNRHNFVEQVFLTFVYNALIICLWSQFIIRTFSSDTNLYKSKIQVYVNNET